MKKGFTLIELAVAVSLLAMVLAFAGAIFNVSIDTHRTAGANAEIVQKVRAITDQLNTDFQGLRKDAPLLIWFQRDLTTGTRYDQIMFFASGDFQSTRLYNIATASGPAGYGTRFPGQTGTPITGNVARIFYGQAQSRDSQNNSIRYPYGLSEQERLLARRQHILTADEYLDRWPDASSIANLQTSFVEEFIPGVYKNEAYEHDSLSLSRWKTLDSTAYGALGGTIITTCFSYRALIDRANWLAGIHNLMCEGVGSFAVQWGYLYSDPNNNISEYRWFPSDDPDRDGFNTDSHFILMRDLPIIPAPAYANFDAFGAFFNIPGATQMNYWGSASLMRYDPIGSFPSDFFPQALKFTFTIYDSKGILEKGRTFTHIVYLD